MGRGTRESQYAWRKVENNNDPKVPDLVAYPPCRHFVHGSYSSKVW